MSSTEKSTPPITFDAARHLTDDAAIVECMNAVLGMGDTDLLRVALSDVARARSTGHTYPIKSNPCVSTLTNAAVNAASAA